GTDYTLMAHAGGVDSPASAKFAVTAARPGAPTALTHAWSGANLTLSWTAPTTGSTPRGYLLFRGTSAGAITTQVGAETTATSITDSTLLKAQSYYYQVFAIDSSNVQSDPSNTDRIDVPRELCVIDSSSGTAGFLGIVTTDPARKTILRS